MLASSGILGFVAVTGGLLHHKSGHEQRVKNSFEENIIIANSRSVLGNMSKYSNLFGEDLLRKILESQSRCSGIDIILQRIEDIVAFRPDENVDAYTSRLSRRVDERAISSFPILKEVDWEFLAKGFRDCSSAAEAADRARNAILRAFMVHAEFLELFTPHLPRVPRDVDGKLIPNKDAGCSPPALVSECRFPTEEDRQSALAALRTDGLVLIKSTIPPEMIESVRESLNIRSSFSLNPKRFDTREIHPEKIFEGDRAEDVSFHQLAPGRYSYQLRCSKLEQIVKPLHAGVMPIVWEHLLAQRSDTLLNRLLGFPPSSSGSPRVFLSDVSLIAADPLAVEDSWHATNGGSGVVVLVPLSPHEKDNANIRFLPGSQKAWDGLSGILQSFDRTLEMGGVTECPADCGDAIVMDARVMRMTGPNTWFNKSKVWVAFHYDFTDRPAPYQWLPRTLFMNALAVAMVHLDNLYRKLPPLSRPNPLE